LALVPAARPARGQDCGATNVAYVSTLGAPCCPRFSGHVQRAGDVVCGRINFRCDTVSGSCPEQSPNFCHKAGRAIDGLGVVRNFYGRNDNNSGPSLTIRNPTCRDSCPSSSGCTGAQSRKSLFLMLGGRARHTLWPARCAAQGTPGVPWRSLCLVKAKLTGVAPPPDIENIKSEWGSARADMSAIERMRISPAGSES
jgi:hypothetical protein